MLKKTITYKDLDGNSVTDEFYFNISIAEIVDRASDDNYVAYLQQIAAGGNTSQMMKTFSEILGMAVGRRSEDGRSLDKSKEITRMFLQSDAYSVLLWELLTKADYAAEFITNVFPDDLAKKAAEVSSQQVVELPSGTVVTRDLESYTQDEIMKMGQTEFDDLFGKNPSKWPRAALVAAMARKTAQ